MVINNKKDLSNLFGEMTFKNYDRKLVSDQNTYDSDYSDNDSSEDDTLFDNGNLYSYNNYKKSLILIIYVTVKIGCYSRKGVNEVKAQIQSATPNQQNKNIKVSDYQPSENLFKKYLDKVNTDPYEGPVLTHEASNKLMESYKKADATRFEDNINYCLNYLC